MRPSLAGRGPLEGRLCAEFSGRCQAGSPPGEPSWLVEVPLAHDVLENGMLPHRTRNPTLLSVVVLL